MNIAVCDDEEKVRVYIRKRIEMQSEHSRIMEFSSGGALLAYWQQKDRERIDILFLDISMAGAGGMETAEQILKWKEARKEPLWGELPLLIFVTSSPECMPKSFADTAFQYLVKPVSGRAFEEVFAQAVREYRHLTARKRTESKEITVRIGNKTRTIMADDIYFIESSNRKIIVSIQDEEIECYGKIGEMENELGQGFFRIHKGYLVNMEHVDRYSRSEVLMKNGGRLLISKYKYPDFIKAYLAYISPSDNGLSENGI